MLNVFRFLVSRNNETGFILNTNSLVLHTKECVDGETGCEPVKAGSRKHYSNYYSAIADPKYKKDHVDCLG